MPAGVGTNTAVGSALGTGDGGIVVHRAHFLAVFADKQFSTHVQPTSHMQNQSSPNALQIPPLYASQPCAVAHAASAADGSAVGIGDGTHVGSAIAVGAGVVVQRSHLFATRADKQCSTHTQPASHMQNHSAPTALHTPPTCASQPCASAHATDTDVGTGVGTGTGVHTGVGTGVVRTHACASALS